MAEKLIISVSGLRGIIGENLDAAIAAQYGCAFGTYLKSSIPKDKKLSVCIGRDSRPSGQMLLSAVASGLCSAGIDVVDIGLAATPTVGVALTSMGFDGGIVITASHNPIPYNGVKLLLADGVAPEPEAAAKIRQIFIDKAFEPVGSVDCGKIACCDNANQLHIDKILKIIDVDIIASKKFKVVLDSVNGAGFPAAKILLEKLGCEIVAVNNEPTGLFAHTPEPTKDNLKELCDIVKQNNADIGFAQDPDADRLAIIDENGTYIGEEYTLALAAKHIFKDRTGSAAANLSTSRMIDDIAKQTNCTVIRTPVGEANVAKAMLDNNCIIGGEGNGGVIDLRVGPVRDSFVAMGLILELMATEDKQVSSLVGEIPAYYMFKDKFKADPSQAQALIEQVKSKFSNAEINTSDGCRIDLADGWLHIRASNTEPVMRIIVEAADKATADKYIEAVSKIRKN